MDATNFNPVYVNEHANAKAFIDHYKTLDNHSLSDREMIAIYNDLREVQALQVLDNEGALMPFDGASREKAGQAA